MSRGLVVAVLGPDGAGKSSLIARLGDRLDAQGIAWTRFHWRVPWRASDKAWEPITDPHGRPPRGRLASMARPPWYVATAWPCWRRNVEPIVRRGGWVVLDRCYDDLLCDPRRYRYGGPLWWARAFGRLMPRADRVLVLAGDAHAIAARKREVPFAELARQIDSYRAAAADPGAVLIDCAQPLDRVLARACEALGLGWSATC